MKGQGLGLRTSLPDIRYTFKIVANRMKGDPTLSQTHTLLGHIFTLYGIVSKKFYSLNFNSAAIKLSHKRHTCANISEETSIKTANLSR